MHTDHSISAEEVQGGAGAFAKETLLAWSGKLRWRAEVYECEADQIPFHQPVAVYERFGNMLLSGGIALLLDLLGGLGGTPFSSGNAYLYVGTGTTAVSSGQYKLEGTTAEAAMAAGYPQRDRTTLTWQGTFGTSAANFRWDEWGIKNATGTPIVFPGNPVLLNRKVEFILEKSSSVSVVFSAALSIV